MTDARSFVIGEEVRWSAHFLATLGTTATDPVWFDVGEVRGEKTLAGQRLIFVLWDWQDARDDPKAVLSDNLLKKGELSRRTSPDWRRIHDPR